MEDLIEKTVTVKFVNQPREGKKLGSIRIQDDSYIGVWPNDLDKFQPKGTYTILCKKYNDSFTFVRMANADSPAPRSQPVAAGNDDLKAEEIFVTGIVGRAMGGGHFGIHDIDALTKAAVAAWRNRNAAPIAPKQKDDLDSEIPF